jgi:hypothetical protein
MPEIARSGLPSLMLLIMMQDVMKDSDEGHNHP